jgi:hypothetical protein
LRVARDGNLCRCFDRIGDRFAEDVLLPALIVSYLVLRNFDFYFFNYRWNNGGL